MGWGTRALTALALTAAAFPANPAPGQAAAAVEDPAFMAGYADFDGYRLHLSAYGLTDGAGNPAGVRAVAVKQGVPPSAAVGADSVLGPPQSSYMAYGRSGHYWELKLWVNLPQIGFVEATLLSQDQGSPGPVHAVGEYTSLSTAGTRVHSSQSWASSISVNGRLARSMHFVWGGAPAH